MADDILSEYMEPTDPEKMAALSAALRRQRDIGMLGMLTGDKVLSGFGGAMFKAAGEGAERHSKMGLQKAMEAEKRRQELADRQATNSEWNRRNAVTSEQDMKRALLLAGVRRDESNADTASKAKDELRKVSVPGLDIEEDASPTPDDAKKMKASLASSERMRGLVAELRDLHQKHGTELGGAAGTRMSQLSKGIQIEAKNIAELGALSGPDLALMQELAGSDPSSIGANLAAIFGVDNTKTSLGGLEKWTDNTVDSNMKAFGYRRKGGQGAGGGDVVEERALPDGRVIQLLGDGSKRVKP